MNDQEQRPSINPAQVAAAALGIFNRADVKAGERETVNVCASFLEAIAQGTLVVSNAPESAPAVPIPVAAAETAEVAALAEVAPIAPETGVEA